MKMNQTAALAVDALGLKDRRVVEEAKAALGDFTETMEAMRGLFAPRRTISGTSLTVGIVIGAVLGVAIGLLVENSMTPALAPARRRMREVADNLQEKLPSRLNITRMDEQPTTPHQTPHTDHQS